MTVIQEQSGPNSAKLCAIGANQYLNNRIEQDHRGIKGRYQPMRGFKSSSSVARFCRSFDELRNFLRPRSNRNQHISASHRRLHILSRSLTVIGILTAAKRDRCTGQRASGVLLCFDAPTTDRNRFRCCATLYRFSVQRGRRRQVGFGIQATAAWRGEARNGLPPRTTWQPCITLPPVPATRTAVFDRGRLCRRLLL